MSAFLSDLSAYESQQYILWVPVLFGLGIALWFSLPDPSLWCAVMALAAMLAMVGVAVGGYAGRLIFWAGLLVCAGMATIWFRSVVVDAPRIDRPVTTDVSGRIERIERLVGRGLIRLTIMDEHGRQGERAMRVRLSVPAEKADMLQPGMKISARARLMPPAPPPVPGGYDFARAAWFKAIGATGRMIGDPVVLAPARTDTFWVWMDAVRGRLTAHVQMRLGGGGEGGIGASLITGDQGGIPEDIAQALRDSGLAHLLSISGLHVSAAVGFGMIATRRLLALSMFLATRLPLTLISAGVGALTGVAYSLLAGGEVPTVRSCIAALLVLLGLALGRDAITLRVVAAGALIILIFRPEALVGPSFQLSFAAVTAIVVLHELPWMKRHFSKREEPLWQGWLRGTTALLLTGLLIEAVLAPIGLFHFNRMGAYGAFANIVAIPWTTFVIMPIEAVALLLDPFGISAPFYWLLSKALTLLIGLALLVANAPGGIALAPDMPTGAFALMIGGFLWLGLWRSWKVRSAGMALAGAGALWAWLAPVPDILITGDGRHMAVRGENGTVYLLRTRTGDYIRSVMGDALAGRTIDPVDMSKAASCSPDACILDLMQPDEPLRILATRSSYFIDRSLFEPACRSVDIIVSDRRLPYWCVSQWLKADRILLEKSGGLAVYARKGQVTSVADVTGQHPWALSKP